MPLVTQHGLFGSDSTNFIRMLPPQAAQHSKKDLALLALAMQSSRDSLGAGPDAEENMFVPAGFTYFGQFIDHDLTFVTTSTFDGQNPHTSLRTPRFDLDCVYGKGPIDQPYMYEADHATLKLGMVVDIPTGRRDLLRLPDGIEIIGGPRNDENSIVSQIQTAFIRFHNSNVAALAATGVPGTDLFASARCHTRWNYQRVI